MLTFCVALFVFALVKMVVALDPRSDLTIVTATYSHCVREAPPPPRAYESTETCTRSWTFHGDHQDTVTLGTGGESRDGTSQEIINPDAEIAPAWGYYLLVALAALSCAIPIGQWLRRPGQQITASYTKP